MTNGLPRVGRCTLMMHTFCVPLDLHSQLGIHTLVGTELMVTLLQTEGKIILNAHYALSTSH